MLWDVNYSDGRLWEAEALRRDRLWIVVLALRDDSIGLRAG